MGSDSAPVILGERPDSYAGDITAEEAWRVLQANRQAVLVDVRTQAEWTFVGVPDLSSLEKKPLLIEWQTFPSMAINGGFAGLLGGALDRQGVAKDAPILFLCRSGARSKAAAAAMTKAGYQACHNIVGGFEGDLDAAQHRGRRNGWRMADLPWIQS